MNFKFASKKDEGVLFFTFGKGDGDQYNITYKSETQQYQKEQSGYIFNLILTNTDTLADSKSDNDVIITFFNYSKEGNHLVLTSKSILF